MERKGLLHIYCGDGKGKTTAALGLLMRAAGRGMRVHLVQLMKGRDTGELAVLRQIPGVTLARCDRDYGFVRAMGPAERQAITACHNRLLADAQALAETGQLGLLVLDELNPAYAHGLLDRPLARHLILQRPPALELALTGRAPDQVFLQAADYISEITALRHPYRQGVPARKGIEF